MENKWSVTHWYPIVDGKLTKKKVVIEYQKDDKGQKMNMYYEKSPSKKVKATTKLLTRQSRIDMKGKLWSKLHKAKKVKKKK